MMLRYITHCSQIHRKSTTKQNPRHPNTFSTSMNALFLALISLFAVASSVQGDSKVLLSWSNDAQWSRSVTIQISKEEEASQQRRAPPCSEAALSALKTEVGEWLRDELIDIFGEDAFTLSRVTGVEDGNTVSLVASFECLKCSQVTDKDSIAYILLFFMQHMMDEWIEEKNSDNADVLAGCMGEDTHVSNVLIREKKAVMSTL
jgi:hypothetical protein